MIPIFPRLALSSPIPDEHFLLKDLKFYEFTQLMNIEVQQAHLDACERKCQEGTLRQALAFASYQVQRKYARTQVIIYAKEPFELKREVQVSRVTDCLNLVVIKE